MASTDKETELRNHLRKTGELSFVFHSDVLVPLMRELGNTRFGAICKEEGFDIDKYTSSAEKLYVGISQLNSLASEEQNKLTGLLQPNQPRAVGELLLAHLKLEYIIDRILADNFKKEMKEKGLNPVNLGFAEKLTKLPIKGLLTEDVVKVLRAINILRNHFAHDIKFNIANFHNQFLERALRKGVSTDPEAKFSAVMEVINRLELLLLLQTPSLEKQVDEILGYKTVLKNVISQLREGKAKNINDALWKA